MASIFDRLEKRQAFPVELRGGTIYLREPTFADLKRISTIAKDSDNRAGALAVALCVVEEDGTIAFPPADGESDADLADRVLTAVEGRLTPSDMRKIEDGIKKLTAPPDAEELAKNS